jgi:hypothetical protein
MNSLYEQILNKMAKSKEATLTKAILTWTICAMNPLHIQELEQALQMQLGEKLNDLERTVERRCGHLIYVDVSQRSEWYTLPCKSSC